MTKPLDEELILALARTRGSIVTVEDHYLMTGCGSAVLECLQRHKVYDCRVKCLGFGDKLIEHGSQGLLLAKYGLDGDGIYSSTKELMTSKYSFIAQ